MVDRTRKEFSDADITKITRSYHAWRGEGDAGAYADVPGFCNSAKLSDIRAHGYVLTPGRYVGATASENDTISFEERFAVLQESLVKHFNASDQLTATIRRKLSEVMVDG